ncbi:MAG TPA: hypothetical protein VFA44_14640 [Gaiellaceae bacterium]|nr:hypothetical protein [Gaiellaceae bacterium]
MLTDELRRIADAAVRYAAPGEELSAVIPAEPLGGEFVFLCAFSDGDANTWVALDGSGAPVLERRLVRDAVAIAAMCELAEETAGGGNLPELRARLAALREREDAHGLEEAEAAAADLEAALAPGVRVASPAYLDRLGAAARRLEQALGEIASSPFAEAMKQAGVTVDALAADIERHYKLELT